MSSLNVLICAMHTLVKILLLSANLFCGADKTETLSLSNDSKNVTSSEVSATLMEHINNSGKCFTSFQINCITHHLELLE